MRVRFRLDSGYLSYPPVWVHEVAPDQFRVDRPGRLSVVTSAANLEQFLLTSFSRHQRRTTPELDVGEFRPRIWRGENNPDPSVFFERQWAICFGGLVNLTRRMQELFRYVEPAGHNLTAYGHESRQLLILAATEAESSLKAVLLANQYERPSKKPSSAPKKPAKPNRWTTDDYIKLLEPMRLHEWRVSLHGYPDFPPVAPFAGWNAGGATQTLPWYGAYNAVKHDREGAFAEATVEHAVAATAAAFVMFVAQFGEPDQRNVDGLGEFCVRERSVFAREQRYVPPSIAGDQEPWTQVPLFT